MPVDGSLHGTANGHEPVVRGMEKYHRETGYTDRQGRKNYRLTLFAKRGMTGRTAPESYLIRQKDGAMFIDTGFHIDMAYQKDKDVLSFQPTGLYPETLACQKANRRFPVRNICGSWKSNLHSLRCRCSTTAGIFALP